jgi:hypothetical protein
MNKLIAVLAVATIMLIASDGARSQDKVAPEPTLKLLFDNDKIRVMEARFEPGAVSVLVHRPPRLLYSFSTGQLKYTGFDDKSEVRSHKAGEAEWRDQETAEVENIGQTEVRLLVIVPK